MQLLCGAAVPAARIRKLNKRNSDLLHRQIGISPAGLRAEPADCGMGGTGIEPFGLFIFPAASASSRRGCLISAPPVGYAGGAFFIRQTQKHRSTMYFGVSIHDAILVALSLCACCLGLLTTLYARALIMLTLAKLGKHTRLCARSLESSQSAVQRLVFLYADFRHCFPSLRAFQK